MCIRAAQGLTISGDLSPLQVQAPSEQNITATSQAIKADRGMIMLVTSFALNMGGFYC